MTATVAEVIAQTRQKIDAIDPTFIDRHPPQSAIGVFQASASQRLPYSFVDAPVAAMFNAATACGPELSKAYHQLVLLELIAHHEGPVQADPALPPVIKSWYARTFARIVDDIVQDRHEAGFYDLHNDKFQKDLGVAHRRIVPAGVQKLNRYTFPLGALKRAGIGSIVRTGLQLLRAGGLGPMYDMHTDSHDPALLAEFNPEGWRRFHMNAAELMEAQPDVLGMYGIGWFNDPDMKRVSPRLAYISELYLETGGSVIRIGPSEGARISALATSPTRRQMVADGTYVPTDYLSLQLRGPLIRWARAQRRR